MAEVKVNVEELLRRTLIPKRYHTVTPLAQLCRELRANKANNSLVDFLEAPPGPRGAFIYGTYGAGKTYAVCSYLVHHALSCSVMFANMETIEAKAKEAWSGNGPGVSELFAPKILLIDDFGKEYRNAQGGSVAGSLFETVIRARTQAAKQTIITSNLPPTELKGIYGEDVVSILNEAVELILYSGSDRR